MNNIKCPVTEKVFNKKVSELQDILVLLDANDKGARKDFFRFRLKIINQYGKEMFSRILNTANGSVVVNGLYHGANYEQQASKIN